MFGLFASPDSKMRESAKNWLEVADKVWHFRRDVIPASDGAALREQTELVRRQVKEKADTETLKPSIENLEGTLRKTGGAIYPKSALVDNIEFLLVAAIVIIGVRTFFVQPFKIPTNSMWPTYNGMTAEIFPTRADEPSAPAVAARAVVFGAWPHRLDAPVDGEVLIPVGGAERRFLAYGKLVPGTTWLVIPTTLREY
ncbi:MAG: signal peptidase, partial [Verrucomicrobia bacterium]|nr:signal peptidase [Verrucomicrobiota bacterium]